MRADSSTRLAAAGTAAVVVGGTPIRVLRLTPAGARQVAGWFEGQPVGPGAAGRRLARRLLDAGIAHPDFRSSPHHPHPRLPSPAGPRESDVTVVIPVRDRHAELARCLSGLRAAARDYGPDAYAVIVVDDCSSDAGAIAEIAASCGARVVRRPVNGGPGAARNTGLAAAVTGLVAFLDSDCVPSAGWLEGLLPHFADPAVGAVAPRIVPFQAGPGWLARYEGASSTLDMGARPSIVRPGARVPYVPGAALVVRRAAAGAGFAAGMTVGEDVDFVWRLAAAGWTIRYEPRAVMGHDHRVRFRAWFSRRADYGTSAAVLEQLHPGAVRPLYASWWTAGAWAALLSRRPATAAAVTAAATARLSRRLSPVTGEPWPLPPEFKKILACFSHHDVGSTPRSSRLTPQTNDNSKKREWGVAWRLALRLAGGGTLAAGRPLGSALSRAWWPLAIPAAVAVPRLRLPVAALMLAPPLLDWAARRPPLDPVRYTAARLLDDAAYSIGVWRGCLNRRTARPLLPSIGRVLPSTGRGPRSASALSPLFARWRSGWVGEDIARCERDGVAAVGEGINVGTMRETLPLFPLSAVLFPGMRLPLNIFEERYRRMVRDLNEGPKPRQIGVVAIRKGRETGADSIEGVRSLHEVGCVAVVRRLDERPDGGFDLETMGTDRFRLLDTDRSRPYFQGVIERLPDDPGSGCEEPVVRRVQAGFREYLSALADRGGGVVSTAELPDDPLLLSYLVAAAMIIDLPDRQGLLAAPDPAARLKAERALLARETSMLRATTSRPAPDFKYEQFSQN